jgi:4'-phosphopantetheinyl transferase
VPEWKEAEQWVEGPEQVIDVWRMPLRVAPQDWELLTEDESERARRIIIDEKRDQKAASRAHLRRILARYLDVDPKAIEFEYGEHGKPSVKGEPAFSFNLSHSADVGLLAITRDIRVGADVEESRLGRAFLDIAERFFSPPEYGELLALSSETQPAAFYRAWTRKEAYLKAWGTGLSFASNRFTITYRVGELSRLVETEMPGDAPARWRFEQVDANSRFAGAICYEGDERPLRFWDAD